MLKRISVLYIILLLFYSNKLNSQNTSIRGQVIEENDSSIIGASVLILTANDSSVVKGTTTDLKGRFKITELAEGNYLIKVYYVGYSNFITTLSTLSPPRFIKIKLKPNTTLDEVVVKTSAIMATQNGDTSSYNSNAFKTNKDAMAEDLITKMPGVTVVDGKIQAQGEDVKTILVDGKPFFGDDPNAVLKNIPAEIIDKVQVFDRRSDQSLFTGFDDGNTSKTINIITKTQFRNGVFGRVYGGYGYEDRYKGGASINRFKDKQRLSVIGITNNINEQNFSSEDLLGVMSSGSSQKSDGGRRGGRGRGGSSSGGSNNTDDFLINAKNGISQTHAIGINYSDQFGEKTSIASSYFFNYSNNNESSNLFRQYVVGNNNGLIYNENNSIKSVNQNHRFSLRLEHKFDSLNSIIFQPKASLQLNNGNSAQVGINTNTALVSDISNDFNSNLSGYNFSLPILYRHAFKKNKRTLSLDLNPSYNGSTGSSNYSSYNNYFTGIPYSDTLDQISNLLNSGFNSSSNITYIEPLNPFNSLSINYQLIYNLSSSSKTTFNKNLISNDYSLQDSLVSNVFNTNYIAHGAGLSYRYQKEKHSFNLGVTGQQAELGREELFPYEQGASHIFLSILPNARYQYRVGTKSNFRVNYRTSNTPPTIAQLQNVLNNSNVLQLSIGNPSLKQNFQNNVSIRYSSVNTLKSTSMFAMAYGNYYSNYIGNNTIFANNDTVVFDKIFLAKGSQISRPENLDNAYTLRMFFNYSFPLKFIKSNLNLNCGSSYNHLPTIINTKINYSKSTSPSIGIVLSSNVNENVDFTISSNSAYNNVVNTIQSNLNSTYFNQTTKIKLNVVILKSIVFQTEYNNLYFSGLSDSFNQSVNLLNAAIGYKFLKDKRAELRLFVFDILNENKSIQRNISETYIEDVKTNILQRYFMLTFTYNFKTYFSKNSADKQKA